MDGIDATLSDLRVAESTSRDVASTAEGASVRAEVPVIQELRSMRGAVHDERIATTRTVMNSSQRSQ